MSDKNGQPQASPELVQTSRARLETYIREVQDGTGFWSYKRGQGPSAEATAWCTLAMALNEREAEKGAAAKGAAFMVASQDRKNGGWSTAPDTGFTDWATGPCLLSLRCLDKRGLGDRTVRRAVDRGLLYLADSRVEFFPVVARLLMLIGGGRKDLEYARGWPWDPDCYHWVEPTSYHLMALKIPGLPPADLYIKIVRFANQFLLENACVQGGWNHGNHISLGAELPPYRLTTAEALLALQEIPDHPKVVRAITVLQSYEDEDSSPLSLALSCLALDAYGKPREKELSYLLDRQKDDGSFSINNMVNGLVLLALSGENPLKMSNSHETT